MRDLEKAAAALRAQMREREHQQTKLAGPIEAFRDRYRQWCLDECVAEWQRDFASVKLVRNSMASLFLDYLQTFDSRAARKDLVLALSKRLNWEEALSTEERELCKGYIQFFTVPIVHSNGKILTSARVPLNEQFLRNGVSNRPLRKREACQMLRDSLKREATASVGKLILDRDSQLLFEAKIADWYVVSAFDMGGLAQLSYSQTIYATEKAMPGTNISKGISILQWLGILNVTSWDTHTAEEVPARIKALLKFCEHFLEAVPSLLASLSPPRF